MFLKAPNSLNDTSLIKSYQEPLVETNGLNFRLLDYRPFPIAVRKQTTAGLSDPISLDPLEAQISPAIRICKHKPDQGG